jgi:type IV pilus assembly protein PilM
MIDYQPLDPLVPDDTNPNMEVLLAVAQQDIINNFVDTVFAAGMDPIAIDIEPLATGRACLDVVNGQPVPRQRQYVSMEAPFEGSGQETVAIVNMGASNTDISIYQNGQLAFPRSLPLAGDSLTRAIAEMLGYTLDQAERIKRDYASVQLERMSIYTGTAYGDDPNYQAPQFRDEDVNFGVSRDSGRISGRSSGRVSGRSGRISGRLSGDDAPLSNPFDLTEEGEEGADALHLGKPGEVDELERTQPMSRRTLNLAAKPEGHGDSPMIGGDSAFDAGFLGGASNDAEVRDQVFEAIAPVLGELGTEIRRSLDYYRSRAQGRSVDRVLLAGGTAGLENIAQFLQNELQVPVFVANPFSTTSVSSKHYDRAYLDSIASSFTVAFGLAAREAVFDVNPAPRSAKRSRAKVA